MRCRQPAMFFTIVKGWSGLREIAQSGAMKQRAAAELAGPAKVSLDDLLPRYSGNVKAAADRDQGRCAGLGGSPGGCGGKNARRRRQVARHAHRGRGDYGDSTRAVGSGLRHRDMREFNIRPGARRLRR